MAEDEASDANRSFPNPSLRPSPSFVEVMCKSSGEVRRFAAGTEAGFALSLINKRLHYEGPVAWLIEAVKEGEEPVSFGPQSVLVDYGDGWKLQTATELEGHTRVERDSSTVVPPIMRLATSRPSKAHQPTNNLLYTGKILVAFLVIFVIAATFTLALENLPKLITFINSPK